MTREYNGRNIVFRKRLGCYECVIESDDGHCIGKWNMIDPDRPFETSNSICIQREGGWLYVKEMDKNTQVI
jgi:hypothetical protein